MEIKAQLLKPYTENEKLNFIVEYNHNQGYVIEETAIGLQALGYTEEEIAQQEKERIARLSCTKRDFALMLQEMGVDYFTQLKPLIDSNPQAQLEWELCERLYRFNPMIDLMAGQLGVTPEMLDGLFQYANGEISAKEFEALIPKEQPEDDLQVETDEELSTDEIVLPDEDIENENTTDIQENTETTT